MFIEVNDLKGLIIDVKDDTINTEWKEVISLIPCVFLVRYENEISDLYLKIGNVQCLVKSPLSFHRTINKALEILGLEPYETAYVTSSYDDLPEALSEPLGTVLIAPRVVKRDYIGFLPDLILNGSSELINVINGQLTGYFAEVNLTIIRGKPFYTNGYVFEFRLQCDDKEVPVFSCGRYLGFKHPRVFAHQFSHRIRRSKNKDDQDNLFADLFLALIAFLNDRIGKIDAITRVPPRPDGSRDRLGSMVNRICSKSPQFINMCGELSCLVSYPPQKGLNKEARLANVKGVFKATQAFRNKRVILLDDVLTTGATITECLSMLYSAGASDVIVATLGVNQLEPPWPTVNTLYCDACDGSMRMLLNRDGRGAFFGCSNFFSENKCKNSLDFDVGLKKKNMLNIRSRHEEDNDDFHF